MIGGVKWHPGRAPGYYRNIQNLFPSEGFRRLSEEKRCHACGGSGERSWRHQFIGGYSHMVCFHCGGDGEERDEQILAARWIKKNTTEIAAKAKAEAMG